jgi:FKBP-type peptidyl-prolyl cis-trans isomerase SlyD
MKITKDKVVSVHYTLTVDGQVADKTTPEKPLDFIFGKGMLLPKFESNLEGKTVGDKVEFTLTPEEGYGVSEPEAIVELPKKIFESDGVVREDILFVGNMIPMMNDRGQIMHGKVVEIKPDIVVMDFNHPMAGKTLNFSVEVSEVREATEKELTEGLHGEFAGHGCGGGCCGGCGDEGGQSGDEGGCGDGCCGGCGK